MEQTSPCSAGGRGCQGRLAFGQGREDAQCYRPQQDILVALCALRPDTWSLHTGPCPGCLSSPCLGPNLCQAEADTGKGVTSIWLPGRNWPKKNSSHKDIPSTYLLDVRSESPSRPRQMVALIQSIFTCYQSHGLTTRWFKVGGWRWGIRPLLFRALLTLKPAPLPPPIGSQSIQQLQGQWHRHSSPCWSQHLHHQLSSPHPSG